MTIYGVNPAGYGVEPDTRDAVVIARKGNISAGYCYAFAGLQSSEITNDGVTISTTPGDVGFPYANIVATTSSADRRCQRFCIALEDALDGQPVRVRVRGLVRARVLNSANAAINIGSELVTSATSVLQLDGVQAGFTGGSTLRKILGLAMEAYSSTPSDGTTMLVDFNGWDGVGSGNAT